MLSAQETRKLLDSIDTSHVVGLRDRALIGTMVYSFARVSAIVHMKVRDYYPQGKRCWIRLHEKGGKFHEVPAHHTAEQYLDEYIETAGISEEKNKPLFRSTRGRSRDPRKDVEDYRQEVEEGRRSPVRVVQAKFTLEDCFARQFRWANNILTSHEYGYLYSVAILNYRAKQRTMLSMGTLG